MTKCEVETRKNEAVRKLTDLAAKLPMRDLVALLKIARAYEKRDRKS